MGTRLVASTEAQNNFGRMLDDAVQNHTRYVIQRRGTAQAILLSLGELERLLSDESDEKSALGRKLRELRGRYTVGESVGERKEHDPS